MKGICISCAFAVKVYEKKNMLKCIAVFNAVIKFTILFFSKSIFDVLSTDVTKM